MVFQNIKKLDFCIKVHIFGGGKKKTTFFFFIKCRVILSAYRPIWFRIKVKKKKKAWKCGFISQPRMIQQNVNVYMQYICILYIHIYKLYTYIDVTKVVPNRASVSFIKFRIHLQLKYGKKIVINSQLK